MKTIAYKSGYKHQLVSTYQVEIPIYPVGLIEEEFIVLEKDGTLTVRKGYAWDGATGAFETPTIMRGSLEHDALYGLIRTERLPARCRPQADDLFKQTCLEDGMMKARAWWVHRGVRIGGGPAADPRNTKAVMIAP